MNLLTFALRFRSAPLPIRSAFCFGRPPSCMTCFAMVLNGGMNIEIISDDVTACWHIRLQTRYYYEQNILLRDQYDSITNSLELVYNLQII